MPASTPRRSSNAAKPRPAAASPSGASRASAMIDAMIAALGDWRGVEACRKSSPQCESCCLLAVCPTGAAALHRLCHAFAVMVHYTHRGGEDDDRGSQTCCAYCGGPRQHFCCSWPPARPLHSQPLPPQPTPAPEYLTEEIPPCTPVHGSSGGPVRAECGPVLDVCWSSHIGSGT